MKNQFFQNGETPPSSRSAHPPAPTHEQIAAVAYQLYRENGCQEGRDLENWLKATELLLEEQSRNSTPALTVEPESLFLPVDFPPENLPLDEREYPFARGERGSASREEIRRQATQKRPAARQSMRPQERSAQSRKLSEKF